MKMRPTSKMLAGTVNWYRTRRLMADDGTIDVRQSKWRNFYLQRGWAIEVRDDLPAAPRRRGRPPRTRVEPAPEPEPAAEIAPAEPASESEAAPEPDDDRPDMNVPELRAEAELRGFDLEPRYYRRDELVAMLKGE